MTSMVLHTILEEINKNTEMGIRESHVPITNELLDSIVASFNSDPSTDDFLHHISEVLQIQVVEQDLLLHEVDTFVSEYAKQISSTHSAADNMFSQSNMPAFVLDPSLVMQQHNSPQHNQHTLQQQQQQQQQQLALSLMQPPNRKRHNFSREITNILMRWLFEHQEHPYPSEQEKAELGHLTGLTMSQISGWFINARRRKLKKGGGKSGGREI